MASKQPLKTTFDIDHVLRPIFTGGSVSIDHGARILATTLGEDAILTEPATGKHLAQIEGVCPLDRQKRHISKANGRIGWREYFNTDFNPLWISSHSVL